MGFHGPTDHGTHERRVDVFLILNKRNSLQTIDFACLCDGRVDTKESE